MTTSAESIMSVTDEFEELRSEIITEEGWRSEIKAAEDGSDFFVCPKYYTDQAVKSLQNITTEEGLIIPGQNPEADMLINFWKKLSRCVTPGERAEAHHTVSPGLQTPLVHTDPGLSYVRLSNPVVNGEFYYTIYPRVPKLESSGLWDIYKLGRWRLPQTDTDSEPITAPITPHSHVFLRGDAYEAYQPQTGDKLDLLVTPPHAVRGKGSRQLLRSYEVLA